MIFPGAHPRAKTRTLTKQALFQRSRRVKSVRNVARPSHHRVYLTRISGAGLPPQAHMIGRVKRKSNVLGVLAKCAASGHFSPIDTMQIEEGASCPQRPFRLGQHRIAVEYADSVGA